eukprot:TRINITY_DN9075_c0_g1_i1.p1 TRINITY_DN9075_c0_g1~~TRINITY_DN9075_c0_g1_i1.p1  ORF type:complete len:378 (+),score=87.48 TRINITY_DN9075_c0_g1_i1:103-1134(+)
MGATMVYSEEIIDKKIVKTLRVENKALGTVDYMLPAHGKSSGADGPVVFRTVPGERVVFQVGTADASLALQAANHVVKDIRAFDVNMGCPKHFSISGGMGAALLSKPEVVEDIMKTLKRNLNIPVTCKIRLLDNQQSTVDLMHRIEKTGVDALAIHARHIPDRSAYAAAVDELGNAIRAANLTIPIIHNADIFRYDEIEEMKRKTGAQSVMIARGAQWNASVFRKEGPLPVYNVMQRYLDLAVEYDNHPKNSKYALMKMIENHVKGPAYDTLNRAKNNAELQNAVKVLAIEPEISGPYNVSVVLKDRALMVAEQNRKCKSSCASHEQNAEEDEDKPSKKQKTG